MSGSYFILSLIYNLELKIFKTGELTISVTAVIISYQKVSKEIYKMYVLLI